MSDETNQTDKLSTEEMRSAHFLAGFLMASYEHIVRYMAPEEFISTLSTEIVYSIARVGYGSLVEPAKKEISRWTLEPRYTTDAFNTLEPSSKLSDHTELPKA